VICNDDDHYDHDDDDVPSRSGQTMAFDRNNTVQSGMMVIAINQKN
jgi:hypothetical protein